MNPPINTATWVNTIDADPPISAVQGLPPQEAQLTFPVSWSGTDKGSGIATYNIYASDNGGGFTLWQQFPATTTSAAYTGQINHTYGFYSIAQDLVGNIEPAKKTAEATTQLTGGDITPPTTTASLSGPTGNNGWYIGPVQVTLTATDPDSPVSATYYSLDGGNNVTYTAPFSVSTDAIHQLSFYSVDPSGNQETPKSVTIKIDKTPPTTSAAANPSQLWPPDGKMVPVTISGAMTDNLSGVNGSIAAFAVTNEYGQVQPSGLVTVGSNGSYSFVINLQASRDGNDMDGRLYTIKVSAQDNAGNPSTATTTVVVPHDQGQ